MASWRTLLLSAFILYISYGVYQEPAPEGASQPMRFKIISFLYGSLGSVASVLDTLGLVTDVAVKRNAFDLASILFKHNHEDINTMDTVFDGVPVRVYTPSELSGQTNNKGMVYYHGGGWTIGSIGSHDATVALLAKEAGVVAVSVEYRLSPEYSVKDGREDCITATKYFLQNADRFGVDPTRIAIAGDSAGGNYAAAVSLYLRDKAFNPMPKLQLLIYPSVQGIDLQLPSYQQNVKGPLLTRHELVWFKSYANFKSNDYIKYFDQNTHVNREIREAMSTERLNHDLLPKDLTYPPYKPPVFEDGYPDIWNKLKETFYDPYHYPLMAKDHSNLPEAYIFTAQYDPLRDDGFLYTRRLSEAGVKVTHYNCPFGFHGMASLIKLLKDSEDVVIEMARFARKQL